MKNAIVSAIMGIVALVLVNVTGFFTGVALSVNFLSLGISAMLGVFGVITMIILGYLI